jgi:hypothetical protein
MSEITIGMGSALSFLGLGAYLGAQRRHVTALIPTLLGIPLWLLGFLGRDKRFARDAMRTAAGISGLGFLVSLQGLLFPQMFPSTAASRDDHPRRGDVQTLTAVLCGIHVGLALRSTLLSDSEAE